MSWLGKRRTHIVESWTDRALVNDEWRVTYPASEVEYLELIKSDHRPVIIKIKQTTERGPKPFYFDFCLCQKQEIIDIVTKCCREEYFGFSVTAQEKIKACRKEILAWRRNNPTNAARRIKELKSNIDQAHKNPAIDLDQIRQMRKELAREYRNEEIFWHQKS